MSNLDRGPSMNASYQVSVYLAVQFQRGRFFNNQAIRKKMYLWAILTEDFSRMIPTKFRFIWSSSFRGDDFLEINQSETKFACAGHAC
jgi:hypothetical protein